MGYPDNFSAKAFSRAHDGPSPEAEEYAREKVMSLMLHLRAIAAALKMARAAIETLDTPEEYPNEAGYSYLDVLTTLDEMMPDTSKTVRDDAYHAALAEWVEMQS